MSGGFVATSYGPPWGGIQGTGVTATGIDLSGGQQRYVVAVDPGVIPLGTRLKVWPNPFGNPNIVFTAADTGGAIKGNRLDFYDWRGRKAQTGWGVRSVTVTPVGKGSPSIAAAATSSSSPASSSSGSGSSSSSSGSSFAADVQRLGLQLVIYGAGGWLAFSGLRRLFSPAGAPA